MESTATTNTKKDCWSSAAKRTMVIVLGLMLVQTFEVKAYFQLWIGAPTEEDGLAERVSVVHIRIPGAAAAGEEQTASDPAVSRALDDTGEQQQQPPAIHGAIPNSHGGAEESQGQSEPYSPAQVDEEYIAEVQQSTAVQASPMSGDFPTEFDFKLKVPFYIYEFQFLDWSNLTFTRFGERFDMGKCWNSTATATASDHKRRRRLRKKRAKRGTDPGDPAKYGGPGPCWYKSFKHAEDYWFLKHAREHPMRTLDPAKAKLFYVPIFFNLYGQLRTYSRTDVICVDGICNEELLLKTERALRASPWFQRSNGKDHIVVDSHFAMRYTWGAKIAGRGENPFIHCNLLTFENQQPRQWQKYHSGQSMDRRVAIPSLYVGQSCGPETLGQAKKFDLTMVASLHPGIPQFGSRRDICGWLKEGPPQNLTATHKDYTMSACGSAAHCPYAAAAKYGFHVRGDTWGSNRVMDNVLNGVVSLFTNPEQYPILPDFVPWDKMTHLIDISSTFTFHESLQRILNLPASDYEAKVAAMKEYHDLFDHTKPVQLDAYFDSFAEKLGLYQEE